MDVEAPAWDEHHIAIMKKSPTHHTTTKAKMNGNAFEHEPPRFGTTQV
jgi:hypothetical protein